MPVNRWLLIALIASVAANLGLAGFVTGRLSAAGPVPAALDPSLGMFRVLRELPEPRRDALRPAFREHFRGLRSELREMRAAQQRINRTLTAEPFDAEALDAALAGFRNALLASQEANHRLLVGTARVMTAEERRLLRDTMSRRPGPHQREGSHRREGPPPQ